MGMGWSVSSDLRKKYMVGKVKSMGLYLHLFSMENFYLRVCRTLAAVIVL